MKKIFTLLALFAFTLPAFATCSLTGAACSASLLTTPSLEDKFLPDNLKNIQKPDAFTPQYVTPYQDMLLNTNEPRTSIQNSETPSYNSNCQFGICLPGATPGEGTIFD